MNYESVNEEYEHYKKEVNIISNELIQAKRQIPNNRKEIKVIYRLRKTMRFNLSEIKKKLDSFKNNIYVNVYFVDRYFGGPEEGGWYFDCGQVEKVYPVESIRIAKRLKERLEKGTYSNLGRRSISSVLSQGQFRVCIENKLGENWPEEKPHYE